MYSVISVDMAKDSEAVGSHSEIRGSGDVIPFNRGKLHDIQLFGQRETRLRFISLNLWDYCWLLAEVFICLVSELCTR